MSSGYDRTYDNSYNNIPRDPYSQNPYQNPNDFRNPNQFNQNQHQYNQYEPPHEPVSEAYQDKYSHVGDFSPFYIAITLCTIIGFTLFILNIALGCCSKYRGYWNDRHTGNRWIVSLWTSTPHNQPPLDYSTELKEISSKNQVVYYHPQEEEHPERAEFLEIRTKRESEI